MTMHTETMEAERPPWRDEYLDDFPGLQRYSEQLRAWQRNSNDPFERVDAELWSRVSASEACAIFLQLVEWFRRFDATGELEAARHADNEARRAAGAPLLSESAYRVSFAREFFQLEMLKVLPAVEV
jgi:hypothetical protein